MNRPSPTQSPSGTEVLDVVSSIVENVDKENVDCTSTRMGGEDRLGTDYVVGPPW